MESNQTPEFIIYPAIDLRRGKVVRLRKGDPERQTIFSPDPAASAQRWIDEGACWLHVINLDGAFSQDSQQNLQALEAIIATCGHEVQVQFGGGLRTLDQINLALEAGVARAVAATAAINDERFVLQAIERFGDQIAFALDAENGKLMTQGWQKSSDKLAVDFAEQLAALGVKTVIFTDISRDGMETGVNWRTAEEIQAKTGMTVIASGGVSTLEHIRTVREGGLDGLIIGRALYEDRFSLREALLC